MASAVVGLTRQCIKCVLGRMVMHHSERWGDFWRCPCGHEVRA